ncbi:hypothetical protein BACCIP111883_02511 [Sutcliffiella rhizosphaerae]|uniref:Uncharacterized protein n=1 Tax=Sutcliffiella rhizosphaerae TaxID=2880967 RepID=A0ABM8YP24_9BACI|nr:hypothetical protein BACCIP111883_02511 [Sutcliffiella rhizosphaerae]
MDSTINTYFYMGGFLQKIWKKRPYNYELAILILGIFLLGTLRHEKRIS